MKNNSRITGRRGEDEACLFLCSSGHTVVARNWRKGHLELDIVTVYEGNFHFVEVKTRNAPCYVDPLSNMTKSKMQHLISAAKCFMVSADRKRIPVSDPEILFDVLTVIFGPDGTFNVKYYPEAFTPLL